MKNTLITLAFLFFLNICFGQGRAANRKVDAFIKDKMEAFGIPGMAVAVVKDGKILKLSSYGIANLEWNNKVTQHTNFQIASSTKLLTSSLLLKAMHDGKINLEDHVGKYLDSIPEQWQQLQVKHLVSHSSGLKDFNGASTSSTATVVSALKDSTLKYMPGQSQEYAQLDFMLLGYILEKIYGKPFNRLLRDEVITPLRMTDGGFDMEAEVAQVISSDLLNEKADTYYDLDGKMRNYKFIYPQYLYTAAGYYASISDLANWAVGLDKETLFPKDFSYEYIYGRDKIGKNESDFTRVGWVYGNENGVLYAGHSGGPGLADILRFPELGYTFIVLTNDGEVLPNFARAIASFYIQNLSPNLEIRKFERK